MLCRHYASARVFRSIPLLVLSLLLTFGCVPTIPEDDFLEVASEFALAPEQSFDQLKIVFGMPFVPTVDNPGEINLAFEEELVRTADGELLRVWYIPRQDARGTLVFSNGAVGDISCYLLIALLLRGNGYSVVLYDYRGFRGSTGTADLTAVGTDLDAVLDWTLARTGESSVTLMGVSVGTIPTVAAAASRPDDVNAIVLDGAISLRHEIKRFAALLDGPPEDYVAQFDDSLLLDEQIGAVTQPMLVFTYGLDEYATSAVVPRITAQTRAALTVYDFPTLAHARGPYLRTEEYAGVLAGFFDACHGASGE